MRRLYFVVPDVATGKKIVDEALLDHVEWRHIHAMAVRGIPLEELPEASFWQKSDIVPAMLRAVPMGGGAGLVAGLVCLAFDPQLLRVGGGLLLATALAGVAFGVLLGGMVGLNVGNTRLKPFAKAIGRGELLVMVDVPKARVEEITNRIKAVHPGAEFEGTEPTIPAFP